MMKVHKNKLDLDVLYATIIEQAPDAVLVLDKDLNVVLVNAQASHQLGYTREELLGMNILDLDGQTDKAIIQQYLQELWENKILQTESVAIRKDGTLLPVEVKVHLAEIGGETFMISFSRDISDRKRVEQNFREEKALMDALVENIPDSIFFKDRECRLIRINRKLVHDLGFKDISEALGKTDIDLFGEEFGSKTMAVDRRVMETGEPSIGLIERRNLPDGSINWTLTTKVPLYDSNGKVTGIAGVSREINQIKKKEEELRIKENQLSIASQIAGLGYWEFNIAENLFTFNDHFYQIFHTTVEEVGTYQMTPEEYATRFLPEEDQYVLEVEISKALQSSDLNFSGQLEHKIKYLNGEIGYIAVRYFLVTDKEGRPIKTFGANQNITERKLAENELATYRDHLEQLVQQRTIQLEDINEDLEAFAYSISHDLRAPLRHINGFSNILKKKLKSVNSEAKEYIDLINDASLRMGTMIDGLLNFSRLGRQKINTSAVDLNKLVAEVIGNFKPDLAHRKIDWHIDILPTVNGDLHLLKIVFENLVSNAIKYTRNEAVAIIEIGAYPDGKSNTTIYFKDNGVGLNMAYSDKLFGVFQRLHNEAEFEGTGIGLANVQQIIKKHGGAISVIAEINKGATFYVTL